MVEVAKVKLANFPSLVTLGDRYSKRFGSLSLWAVRGLSGVSIGQNSASNVSHFEGDISRCKNYFDLFRLHNPPDLCRFDRPRHGGGVPWHTRRPHTGGQAVRYTFPFGRLWY